MLKVLVICRLVFVLLIVLESILVFVLYIYFSIVINNMILYVLLDIEKGGIVFDW